MLRVYFYTAIHSALEHSFCNHLRSPLRRSHADMLSSYLITLTIAPVFMTAAIYLTLSRTIILSDEQLSRLKPRTIAIVFMSSDIISLVLQAAGGGIADTAPDDDPDLAQMGIDIMVAGLVLQCVSLMAFLAIMIDFLHRCTNKGKIRFKTGSRGISVYFIISLLTATLAILARSIFRAAELWGGFSGYLWNSEMDFMICDGALMALSVLLLTIWHPGVAFAGQWAAAKWHFRSG